MPESFTMHFDNITDWDDAYSNAEHISNANSFITKWPKQAAKFRKQMLKEGRATLDLSYGNNDRNLVDIFYPAHNPKGLVVFVHGGYWIRFCKDDWSHLASGAIAQGWIIAIPSYSLCPNVRISDITKEIAKAIEFVSSKIKGPIHLAGHSAGGHLVARMICKKSPLSKKVQSRIANTVAVSPLADLRPFLRLKLNDTLGLKNKDAKTESPALNTPIPGARITCWVGASERPEFIRQNLLLATMWQGLGAKVTHIQQTGRHHFNVIEDLADPNSKMVRTLLE